MCDNQLDRPDLEERASSEDNRIAEDEKAISEALWESYAKEARTAGKTFRDKYCDGPNPLGVRRYDGFISAFTYMAEDGSIVHEWP
ncbi:hypothetical protein JW756_03485 [Candidatus Woesearchaeota archaeon]|nr:hypothetical protein [Candidatus Woesearchaeota archaeon]